VVRCRRNFGDRPKNRRNCTSGFKVKWEAEAVARATAEADAERARMARAWLSQHYDGCSALDPRAALFNDPGSLDADAVFGAGMGERLRWAVRPGDRGWRQVARRADGAVPMHVPHRPGRAPPAGCKPRHHLNLEWLESALADYPNRELVRRLCGEGGVPFEFFGPHSTVEAEDKTSDPEQTAVLFEEIRDEWERGNVLGPYLKEDVPFPWWIVAPMYVLRQGGLGEAGKWRPIHNLAAPPGRSLNDGLRWWDADHGVWTAKPEIKFDDLRYAVPEVQRMLDEHGKVSMFKVDMAKAYRQLPLRRGDARLQGLKFFDVRRALPADLDPAEKKYYYFFCKPSFGATASVWWFHHFSRAVKWLFGRRGLPGVPTELPEGVAVQCVYVDDTLVVCAVLRGPDGREIDYGPLARQRVLEIYAAAGIKVNLKKLKLEGEPEPVTEFLGVLIDSEAREARLGEDRVEQGMKLLEGVKGKRVMLKKDLEKLVGWLNWAAMVCAPARIFLRRLYDLLGKRGRWVKLTRGAQADLAWWRRFWRRANGVAFFSDSDWRAADDCALYTDASTSTGYGAVFGNEYFYGEWPEGMNVPDMDINALEMLVFLLVAWTWGPQMKHRRTVVHADNTSAVAALNNRTSKDAALMVILRRLWEEAAVNGFDLSASLRGTWTAGVDNPLADALSRGAIDKFLADYSESDLHTRFGPPVRRQVDQVRLRSVILAVQKACAASERWQERHEGARARAAEERARRDARATGGS
jgi:hypothetical protein